MYPMSIKRKGQSVVEYMALVCIILGALIGGGFYFKRGIQGRWRASIDDLGDQYDPRYTNTSITHGLRSNMETVITTYEQAGGFWTIRDDYSNVLETKTGTLRIGSP